MITHGLRQHQLYNTWRGMKDRCTNPNHIHYNKYGGRGITIYKLWLDFKPFYDWAILNHWSSGLTIDRIDNNKGYYPDNCRFVSMKIQTRNKSSNKKVKAFNEEKTLIEWSEDKRCTVCYGTLKWRLLKGLSPEEAITKKKG